MVNGLITTTCKNQYFPPDTTTNQRWGCPSRRFSTTLLTPGDINHTPGANVFRKLDYLKNRGLLGSQGAPQIDSSPQDISNGRPYVVSTASSSWPDNHVQERSHSACCIPEHFGKYAPPCSGTTLPTQHHVFTMYVYDIQQMKRCTAPPSICFLPSLSNSKLSS